MPLPPLTKIFELLCSRESAARSGANANAARRPWKRFAAIDMPMPLLQIKTPHVISPFSMALETFTA